MSNTQQSHIHPRVSKHDGTDRISTSVSPVIAAHNLTRTYGSKTKQFQAVAGVSCEIYPGEVYGLLGTNGAGKTSTLELLEGIAAPTSGNVTVLGADPYTQRAVVRPQLGIMLQSGGLPQQLTTQETLKMWAGTCSTPRPVAEVLEEVNLSHRRSTKVGALSGGEQRRLDLACALVGQPAVIFLDEPTTGLDPESRRHTWDLLLEQKRNGVTMVLTTHYLEEAEYLCDRVGIMHQGTMRVEGSLRELSRTATSCISFVLPEGIPTSDFPVLPAASIEVSGTRVRIHTNNLQSDATAVLNWADQRNMVLSEFKAQQASLESVFMSIAKG